MITIKTAKPKYLWYEDGEFRVVAPDVFPLAHPGTYICVWNEWKGFGNGAWEFGLGHANGHGFGRWDTVWDIEHVPKAFRLRLLLEGVDIQ